MTPLIYSYVLADPVNFFDPIGEFISVSQYKGREANKFDHVGIGIDSVVSVGKYANSSPFQIISLALDWKVPAKIKIDNSQRLNTIIIDTTPKQEEAIRDFIIRALRNNNDYQLVSANCVDFVANALRAGGIFIPESATSTPSEFIEFLEKRYGKDTVSNQTINKLKN